MNDPSVGDRLAAELRCARRGEIREGDEEVFARLRPARSVGLALRDDRDTPTAFELPIGSSLRRGLEARIPRQSRTSGMSSRCSTT